MATAMAGSTSRRRTSSQRPSPTLGSACPKANGRTVCPVSPERCPCPGKKLRIDATQALERECKRWGAELHDGPAQSLGNLILKIDGLRRSRRDSDPELARALDDIYQELAGCHASVRRMIEEARAPFAGGGLLSAIRAYTEKLAAETGLTIRLDLPDALEGIHANVQIMLFRVVQEALLNVKKHARATQVAVRVDSGCGHLAISIEDDGVGFDPDLLEPRMGSGGKQVGIAAMRERAEILGGFLEITSRPGQGTRVRVVVPRVGTMGSGVIWLESESR